MRDPTKPSRPDFLSFFAFFTTLDVQICSPPERIDNIKMAVGLHRKQKELTKTFMIISNWEKFFGLHGLDRQILVL